MYPKHHAWTSGLATLLYGMYTGLSPVQLVVWTGIGIFTGVFIDIDHFLLGITLGGKWNKARHWLRKPVEALTQPRSFVEDVWYDNLLIHRLLVHVLVFAALFYLRSLHPFFTPALIGLGVHIIADIVEDLRHKRYWTPGFQP